MKRILSALLLLTVFTAKAQLQTPKLSPSATITQLVGLTTFKIEYSRPGVRERKIFGNLVPYDTLWRTGANASSKIEFNKDIKIAGKKVKAGKYALYSIPGKKEWKIILHKNITHWGTGGNDFNEKENAVVVTVPSMKLKTFTENFTLDFQDVRVDGSAKLRLMWEKVEVIIPIETNVIDEVTASIDALTDSASWRDFYDASTFLLSNVEDYDKALMYVNRSLEKKFTYYSLYIKARILFEMGKFSESRIEAITAKAEALKDGNEAYVKNNEKLLKKIEKAQKN